MLKELNNNEILKVKGGIAQDNKNESLYWKWIVGGAVLAVGITAFIVYKMFSTHPNNPLIIR